jgi:hypothetical protein
VHVDHQIGIGSEIARLKVSIACVAAGTGTTLAGRASTPEDEEPDSPSAEQRELRRQLAALRAGVAAAEGRSEDLFEVRAELATLLCFARTLQADAERWRSRIEQRQTELAQRAADAQRERLRLVAEHEKLVRHRADLESEIARAAARIAPRECGDWRRTVPVITLAEGLTVCSIAVSCPGRGLRSGKRWLVTPNAAHDGVVIRPQ